MGPALSRDAAAPVARSAPPAASGPAPAVRPAFRTDTGSGPVVGTAFVPAAGPDDGPAPGPPHAVPVEEPVRRGRGGQFPVGVEAIRGARQEIRGQMREQRRLKTLALAMASLLVLGALPLYFGIRAATRDPVFTSLDALAVPAWAAASREDDVDGSRWCLMECRFRERTVESQRGPDETAQVYEKALRDAGWQPWKVAFCPEQPVEGHYSCWRRDELTLDLWVREPACAYDPMRQRPTVGPTDPAAPGGADAQDCTGSRISVKVRNAIGDERTRPQPSTDPSLTGEDPDPVFTDDPLKDLTPSPS